MPSQTAKIALLVPCYSEAVTIGVVVADFRRVLPRATLYVYDNKSTDPTIEVARAAGARLPLRTLAVASYASTAIGMGFLVFLLYSGRYRWAGQPERRLRPESRVVFGVISNAAVCGVMSGLHDRYQARVAWLIPAMALYAHYRIYGKRWGTREFAAAH